MIEETPMSSSIGASASRDRSLRFQRRSMLKMMMALPIAGFVPLSSLAAEIGRAFPDTSTVTDDAAAWHPRVFNAHEWKTVGVLSDWILPADESSGSATDAGVPEFIDDWLEFQGGDLLVEIRAGLTWLDAECRRCYRQGFVDCATDQQRQILDRIAYPEKAAAADAGAVAFFNQMRDLVLSGFYTSEMGIRSLPYVGNEPQNQWRGCPAPVLAKLGV
jgi:gluconate 2-dehydrogenase gamma chain